MDTTTVIVICVVAVVVAIVLYVSWRNEKERREALQTWARSQGWNYNEAKDRQTYKCYSFLDRLRRGSNRYAFDTLYGKWDDYPGEAFNFHYETYSTQTNSNGATSKKTHHHYLGVVLIKVERDFPRLSICREGFMQKIGNVLGFSDINFESIEFSRKFAVHSQDKRFAYDFCHTRMMEYLLNIPDIDFELNGNVIVLYYKNGKLKPEYIESLLMILSRLRQLMPNYLFYN